MSNPPSGSGANGQRANHLQSEQVPFSMTPAYQIAQMAAAASGGYVPKPYSNAQAFATGGSTVPSNSSNQTKPAAAATTTQSMPSSLATPPKQPSEFYHSAMQTAQKGSGRQPPPAQPIDLKSFKGCKFVILDGVQLETREIYDEISGTFQWEMCESQGDNCVKFIREKCFDRRVFLISSGSLGRNVVPLIHDLPQVYAIYIYCADVPSNQQWSSQFSKVRVVCNDDDKYLLPQLAVDVAQANIEWGDALVKDGKRDKAREKYEKALKNLTKHTDAPDPQMIAKVEAKLKECQ